MSLGTKTLLFLGTAFAVWSLLLYFAIAALLRGGYSELEQQDVERNCQRARSIVDQLLDSLASKCGDWAQWDDSYNFVAGTNDKFAADNITAEALATLNIDFLAFVDAQWRPVRMDGLDAAGPALVPPPQQLQRMLAADGPLRQLRSDESVAGIVLVDDLPFLIACRPILHSDLSGPANGRLVFGRRLDADLTAKLAETAHSDLRFAPLRAPTPTLTVQPVDEDTIEGRFVIADVNSRPALLGTLREPRSIHAQGEQSLRLLLLALVVTGAIGLLTALLGTYRLVLGRLARVRGALVEVTRTGDLTLRSPEDGGDEIAEVARSLNAMIGRLHCTQQELIAANESRTRFLANVSHEVRTPVNAMLGFAELLTTADVTPETRVEYATTIRRNGKHMLTMLNDLLDTAKVESGQMGVECITVDLPAMLLDLAACLRQSALDKGVKLGVELCTPIPATIQSDPTRLRQILTNLLTNAVKFTNFGEVRLRVGMSGDGQLSLAVTDTGIGISQEQQTRLFKPFIQADNSTTRRFGGTGLGLALSRQLARLLGGDVTCSSAPGTGSTFTAVIDVGALAGVPMVHELPAHAAATAAPPAETRKDLLCGRRILIADDAADNRRLVSLMLRKAGASVQIASDGLGAVAAVLDAQTQGMPIDLVLMDMQMPVLDGCEATALLRERGCRAPIIALTASAMHSDRERCLQAGCNDYLSKPIERVALLEHVAAAIARAGAASAD